MEDLQSFKKQKTTKIIRRHKLAQTTLSVFFCGRNRKLVVGPSKLNLDPKSTAAPVLSAAADVAVDMAGAKEAEEARVLGRGADASRWSTLEAGGSFFFEEGGEKVQFRVSSLMVFFSPAGLFSCQMGFLPASPNPQE